MSGIISVAPYVVLLIATEGADLRKFDPVPAYSECQPESEYLDMLVLYYGENEEPFVLNSGTSHRLGTGRSKEPLCTILLGTVRSPRSRLA